jgi:acetyl-CoA C-acetyltransferase
MRKVAVVGVGETKFSGPQEKTGVELLSEATMDALNESNLKPKDIQAFFVGNVYGDIEEGQCMVNAFTADNMGFFNVPSNKYEGACASGSMAARDAFMLVAAGYYDIVMVGGVERAATMGTPMATRAFAMASDGHYEFPAGLTFPGVFALLAHLYASTYNIPVARLKEQLAACAVQGYKYGKLNEKAHLRKDVTFEQAVKSFMVASPLGLHDCCPFSDGAAAAVFTTEEVAKKLTRKPVYLIGAGQASSGPLASQQDYLPRIRARELSAQRAYAMAGIKPQDVNICELHDCFTIAGFISAEGLGFFDYGKAGEAWEKGQTALGSKIQINLSGGLKSKGHPIGATGVGQVYEIVKQLRGEVEAGRIPDNPRIGMTDTLGGDGGTLCNLILQRGW